MVVQLSYLGNWEDIKDEICSSNVVQRNSLVFAKKLDRNLTDFATEMENEIQTFCILFISLQFIFQAKNFDNLWAVQARRALLFRILDKWVKMNSEKAIVEKLVCLASWMSSSEWRHFWR